MLGIFGMQSHVLKVNRQNQRDRWQMVIVSLAIWLKSMRSFRRLNNKSTVRKTKPPIIDTLNLERLSYFNVSLLLQSLNSSKQESEDMKVSDKRWEEWEQYMGILYCFQGWPSSTLSPHNLDLLSLAQLCHICSASAYHSSCANVTPAPSVLGTQDPRVTGLTEQPTEREKQFVLRGECTGPRLETRPEHGPFTVQWSQGAGIIVRPHLEQVVLKLQN